MKEISSCVINIYENVCKDERVFATWTNIKLLWSKEVAKLQILQQITLHYVPIILHEKKAVKTRNTFLQKKNRAVHLQLGIMHATCYIYARNNGILNQPNFRFYFIARHRIQRRLWLNIRIFYDITYVYFTIFYILKMIVDAR